MIVRPSWSSPTACGMVTFLFRIRMRSVPKNPLWRIWANVRSRIVKPSERVQANRCAP